MTTIESAATEAAGVGVIGRVEPEQRVEQGALARLVLAHQRGYVRLDLDPPGVDDVAESFNTNLLQEHVTQVTRRV